MYIIVVGCSQVGVALAVELESKGHNVVVIERDRENIRKLGRAFSGITVVGNGFAPATLEEAGIKRADALIAATDNDNTNIVSVQVARKLFKLEKAFARIYDPGRAEIYQRMGIEGVSATSLVAEALKKKLFQD